MNKKTYHDCVILQLWLKPFTSPLENWMELGAIASLLIIHIASQYSILTDSIQLTDISSFSDLSTLQWFILSYDLTVVFLFVVALLLPTWKTLSHSALGLCVQMEAGSELSTLDPHNHDMSSSSSSDVDDSYH